MSNLFINEGKKQLFVVREWGSELGFNLEIRKCLEEYHGPENVEFLIIPNKAKAHITILDAIQHFKPTNIYIDTRIFIVDAKVFNLARHLREVSTLNLELKKAGVRPICIVTDAQAPGYCLVAELLTHRVGYIVPIGSDFRFQSRNRNLNQLPGMFNPISLSTAESLNQRTEIKTKDVFLGGNLYEPRKSYMTEVVKKLSSWDIQVEISSKKSSSYNDYLLELSQHKIVLNTNFIANSTKVHMVGRNIEALHSGALLITQDTPLLLKYFQRDQHYLHASSPTEAANLINYFLQNPLELSAIAKRGNEAALQFARDRYFVSTINKFIGQLYLREKK